MEKVSRRKVKKSALSPIAPKNVRARTGTCVTVEEGSGCKADKGRGGMVSRSVDEETQVLVPALPLGSLGRLALPFGASFSSSVNN